ncbi:MAG: hypothetical protein V3V35_08780 [Dehalococcoidia bacterium]
MKSGIWSMFRRGHSGRAIVGAEAGLVLAVVAAVVALLVAVAGPSGPASATDVLPVLVEANPDCGDFGQNELVRIDPVVNGTFPVAGGSITIVVNNGAKTFDWTSTVGIDSIIVKGGPDANLYVYIPASFGDTGLHAPENPKNGRFYGLSHISFCGPGEPPDTPTPTPTNTPTPTDECPTPTPTEDGGRDPCLSPSATPVGPTPTPLPPGRS